jgi:hypothetical protein
VTVKERSVAVVVREVVSVKRWMVEAVSKKALEF